MRGFLKDKRVWIVIGMLVLIPVTLSFFIEPSGDETEIAFTDALAAMARGEVDSVEVSSRSIVLQARDGTSARAKIGRQTDVVAAMQAEGISASGADGVRIEFASPSGQWMTLIINLALPVGLLFAVYWAARTGVERGMAKYAEKFGSPRE